MHGGIKALWLLALAWGLAVSAGSGCSRSGRSPEEFIPPASGARTMLETALKAWQEGKPDGKIPHTEPAIVISDTLRKPGQKLDHFEILGEAPGNTPRCFAVRLFLANPQEELAVRYAVLGIDPIYVLRHEDLEMLEHWDHQMMLERARERASAPVR